MTVVAHAGHWAIQLLYAVPVFGFLGALVWAKIKERRMARHPDPDGRD